MNTHGIFYSMMQVEDNKFCAYLLATKPQRLPLKQYTCRRLRIIICILSAYSLASRDLLEDDAYITYIHEMLIG